MSTTEERQVWRIGRVRGYTMTHPVIVTAPGCPDIRHPTRDCLCKVFKTTEEARDYVADHGGVVDG